jgi:hypothetical protein
MNCNIAQESSSAVHFGTANASIPNMNRRITGRPPARHDGRGRLPAFIARHKILTGIGGFIMLSLIVHAVDPSAADGKSHTPSVASSSTIASATSRPIPTPAITDAKPAVATRAPSPADAKQAATARTPSAAATKRAAAIGASFPPKTVAEFRAFAATGDASQVHEVGTASEGSPSCPTPNIYVTVSPTLTGRTLEADISAFFLQNGLLASQCQAFVFAYHSRSDYLANRNDGFTAGRVAVTNNYGSPQWNLEVDTGSAWSQQTQFDFNY